MACLRPAFALGTLHRRGAWLCHPRRAPGVSRGSVLLQVLTRPRDVGTASPSAPARTPRGPSPGPLGAPGGGAGVPTHKPGSAAEPLPLDELGSLVDQLRGKAPQHAVDWMAGALGALQEEQRDRAALLKRSWSDAAFEGGEAANEETLEGFELELVDMLRDSGRGLADGTVLGNAIDLAGAYKKNYKLDKAEAVLLRCTRHAELRSGAWMVKYLNHISQVRMKQRRDVEAMEMMYEIESLANFPIDEPGASQFYETLYRNMSAALRSMGREDEAAVYFTKMADASRHHKESLDWMDLWDLGILMANRAYHSERWSEFQKARETLEEALRLQQIVEPHELILRAKVLSNLGQCYLATDEHDEADVHYSEAYRLFDGTVGKRSPLFGMQAWACGNLRCAQGRYAEALPLLGEALYVEVVGDGLSVSEMSKLVDQILHCLNESPPASSAAPPGTAGTEPIRRSLSELLEDPRWARLPETLELAVLAHKAALVHVAAGWRGEGPRRAARAYSARAVGLLGALAPGEHATRWLVQAEAVQRAVFGP